LYKRCAISNKILVATGDGGESYEAWFAAHLFQEEGFDAVLIISANYNTKQAHRDGHIVTAQTWESHPEFYREIMHCPSGS
jgi:putative intracellular protease/amidase